VSKLKSKFRNKRTAVAAKFIESGSTVLDLGCGGMLIKEHLPENVAYSGYDVNPEVPGVLPIDLDAREFPEGHWDYIVLLGVLPWITERDWTLENARSKGTFLIVTRKDERFDRQIEAAGWSLKEKLPYVDPVNICLYA